jgi:dipeptidyl aminopeptidase/acylaminoacyl peptidase
MRRALVSLSVLALAACASPPAEAPAPDATLGAPQASTETTPPASGPAETTTAFGGQGGADMSIEAIQPSAEPVRVGLAGEDPSDIARYLLASGPGATELSPDGKTIAFVWTITGTPQLWTMPAAGGQPKQLTFGNGVNFMRWTPDGSSLLYGADNDGNEQQAYYAIAADGSKERVVLPAAEGGFRSFGDFAADGSFIYSSTERNGLDFDIWRSDLSGKAEMIYQGSFAFIAESLSPDGSKAIVTETVGEDSDNLYLLDMKTRALSTISKPSPRANNSGGGFVWKPDSSGFWFASNEGREFSALMYRDVAAGNTTLVEEAAHNIGGLGLCGAQDRYLTWLTNEDGFFKLHGKDLRTGKALKTPTLPEGVYGSVCADKADAAVLRVTGWKTPGTLLSWDIAAGTAREVFAGNSAGLNLGRLVRPEVVRMKARDGVELQGLLYLPDAASRKAGGPPPVIFDVHGGPSGQSMASFNPVAQYHVDRGVAVFAPNVRGSTGLGRTYSTLDDQTKRLDSVRDLVDMLDYFKQDGRVDASRAAVMGGSYGGYMVNAVLAAYPDAFKAGVSLFGVADWITALEVASPGLKASDRIEYGDITEQQWRDFYTVNSPIRQADRIKVPVLYSHGVRDPRIDIAETETMVKTLRKNGVRADFIRIPDEGHGWRKLSNRLFYYRRQAAFIEEQLGVAEK